MRSDTGRLIDMKQAREAEEALQAQGFARVPGTHRRAANRKLSGRAEARVAMRGDGKLSALRRSLYPLLTKRERYVERLGRSTVNKRRDKRRRRAAALKAQAKHCLTCGTIHAGWCPPEAFVVVTCYNCGNAFIQPTDVPEMNGLANCGQCGSKETWNTHPAGIEDMRKHWKGYGEGQGAPNVFVDKGAATA
jgi:hypothetical protein